MILVWGNKVYRVDEDTIYKWSGTSEKLRAFKESLHERMSRRETALDLPEETSEDEIAFRVVDDTVMQIYMRMIVAVLEDLQRLMGKRDFNKCFKVAKATPRSARLLVHNDRQVGFDLDAREELRCGVCNP